MNLFSILASAFTWFVILTGGWIGWQLLRQNGRLLLRVEELEKRLDEWEFGGVDEVGSTPSAEQGEAARANRFGNRSPVRSKIKRDGLKAGTTAPDFKLPRLDGRGDLSLGDFRGRHLLLVFSDPHCGPCNSLAPELEKFHHREGNALSFPDSTDENGFGHATGTDGAVPSNVRIVMISRGEPAENRAKVKEHGLTFPIVLQQQWEVSRRYAMFATPIAYLIDEEGVIVQDIAVGVDAILNLMNRAESSRQVADAYEAPSIA